MGTRSSRILIVAPEAPPYGGMALQARKLSDRLREDGNTVIFLASNFRFQPWLRSLERLPVVRTFLRALTIWWLLWRRVPAVDVVHILAASWLYFFVVVTPAVIVARLCGKRIVLNYRAGDAARFFHSLGWLAAPVFRLADAITTPSEFLAQVIRSRFGLPVSIVPNILDSRLFPFRQRTSIQPKLLVTRHLEKLYDVESVLKAFRQVRERYPQARLWIAGTGSQEKYLLRLVSTWGLINHVRFLGHVAHADLPAVYDQCDIYLNGSRVDNFPGGLLEASAAGLIVVSTAAGGIPFIYRNRGTALLVEPGDWQALALAVTEVLETPQLAQNLITAAAALAHSYGWREVRKPLYSAYGLPVPGETANQTGTAEGEATVRKSSTSAAGNQTVFFRSVT